MHCNYTEHGSNCSNCTVSRHTVHTDVLQQRHTAGAHRVGPAAQCRQAAARMPRESCGEHIKFFAAILHVLKDFSVIACDRTRIPHGLCRQAISATATHLLPERQNRFDTAPVNYSANIGDFNSHAEGNGTDDHPDGWVLLSEHCQDVLLQLWRDMSMKHADEWLTRVGDTVTICLLSKPPHQPRVYFRHWVNAGAKDKSLFAVLLLGVNFDRQPLQLLRRVGCTTSHLYMLTHIQSLYLFCCRPG